MAGGHDLRSRRAALTCVRRRPTADGAPYVAPNDRLSYRPHADTDRHLVHRVLEIRSAGARPAAGLLGSSDGRSRRTKPYYRVLCRAPQRGFRCRPRPPPRSSMALCASSMNTRRNPNARSKSSGAGESIPERTAETIESSCTKYACPAWRKGGLQPARATLVSQLPASANNLVIVSESGFSDW
jgi:hypothetical protein